MEERKESRKEGKEEDKLLLVNKYNNLKMEFEIESHK